MLSGMNIKSGKSLARAFYNLGADAIHKVSREGIENDEGAIEQVIAGTANIAFACELSIKLLLFGTPDWSKAEKTHNLETLYMLLDKNKREFVEATTTARYQARLDNPDRSFAFESELSKMSNSFVELRYWHELPGPGRGKTASVLFVECLGWSLLLLMDSWSK